MVPIPFGVLTNLSQHEALHADLLRADVLSAFLSVATDPDDYVAVKARLQLAFMLGGKDDKNNPHIVAASAAVPNICEGLRGNHFQKWLQQQVWHG